MNSIFKKFEHLSVKKRRFRLCWDFERSGLESQRSRKRLFFHRKIFKIFKYYLNIFKEFENLSVEKMTPST